MAHYDNPSCVDINEFYEDLLRTKYIKRLLRKNKQSGELRTRLIFNHLIVLYNVFGIEAATVILFSTIDADLFSTLKTILVFLGYFPENSPQIIELIGSHIYEIEEVKEIKDLLNNQYHPNDLRSICQN